jgi:hypothetical protein
MEKRKCPTPVVSSLPYEIREIINPDSLKDQNLRIEFEKFFPYNLP